jgi:hypothetical protein
MNTEWYQAEKKKKKRDNKKQNQNDPTYQSGVNLDAREG